MKSENILQKPLFTYPVDIIAASNVHALKLRN